MSKFVTATLKGQMGNQMFIVQAIVGLAKKHNIPWALPVSMNDPNCNIPFYMTDEFRNQASFFDAEISNGNGMIINADTRTDRIYYEHGFEYKQLPYLGGSLRLDGNKAGANGNYCSFMYSEGHDEYISKLFGFDYEIKADAVSLHIRRKDYLQLSDHLTVLPLLYYKNAINYFIERGYFNFKVFSDDIEWCKDYIPAIMPLMANVSYSEGNTALKDMQLMMSCRNNIIANSTFSMWSAKLNSNPDKIVVCPPDNEYFGPAKKHLNTSTLFPKDWIRISA